MFRCISRSLVIISSDEEDIGDFGKEYNFKKKSESERREDGKTLTRAKR